MQGHARATGWRCDFLSARYVTHARTLVVYNVDWLVGRDLKLETNLAKKDELLETQRGAAHASSAFKNIDVGRCVRIGCWIFDARLTGLYQQ